MPHPPVVPRRTTARRVFADEPEVFDRFVAGLLAGMRDLTLFFAPNINSYKRFAAGSFAPTAVAWGNDNRTCSLRVVGARVVQAGREPHARAPTSTRTWPWRR